MISRRDQIVIGMLLAVIVVVVGGWHFLADRTKMSFDQPDFNPIASSAVSVDT